MPKPQVARPDYPGLVQFLIRPFLESPDSLSWDCEESNHNQRVWIRLAFEGTDKGRVYGRGGRNLQAIRTVLATAAAAAGQSLYLDIYESPESHLKRRQQPSPKPESRRKQSPRGSAAANRSLRAR